MGNPGLGISPSENLHKMKDFEPTEVDFEETDNPGRGCGCMLRGCGIVFLLLLLICAGSFYGLMHTSLPLTMIKRGLEEDGQIKIQGLTGSISEGFEIDKLEFPSYGGKWSELRGVKFRFNGIYDLARNQRFIIENASVDSGTIYAELEESEDFDPDINADWAEGVAEGINDINQEFEDEDVQELQEIRIDMMSVDNLTIINPDTELSLEIQHTEFKDFQILDGQVSNLGRINVKSDHLDLDTAPSERFAGDSKLSWRLDGRLKSALHDKLLDDIPFQVDLVIREKNQVESYLEILGGQVTISNSSDGDRIVELVDFSPANYIQPETPLSASHWHIKSTTFKRPKPISQEHSVSTESSEDESPDSSMVDQRIRHKSQRHQIALGSSFFLGNTRFEIETTDLDSPTLSFIGKGDYQGAITAHVTWFDKSPFTLIQLESDDGRESKELWAQLFFEKEFDSLSDEEQAQVTDTLKIAVDHKDQ
jgi:hypothetical protein